MEEEQVPVEVAASFDLQESYDLEDFDVVRHAQQQGDKVLYNNALRENIETKGRNSYYYAHGHPADGPAWDGKEAPRLLHVDHVHTEHRARTHDIPAYMWADAGKKVKLYVETDFLGAGVAVAEEDVHLSSTSGSVTVSIAHGEHVYALLVEKLHKSIAGASFSLKHDKVIVSLVKEGGDDGTWYKLHD